MNEKYQRHLEVAKKSGITCSENALKRAFRNLEKIEKAEARKERLEQKRLAKKQEKQELLNMKLETQHNIFLMKKQKCQQKPMFVPR